MKRVARRLEEMIEAAKQTAAARPASAERPISIPAP
jgi:hypothetical protein